MDKRGRRNVNRPRIVAVGASAGGLEALSSLLEAMPAGFQLPILVVQHLAPTRESSLPKLLGHRSALPVQQVQGGERPLPGHVYIAPPDHHLVVEDGKLALTQAEPVRFSRPSVDVLFESVAKSFDGGVIGVILSGGGSDGTEGARAIREAGGRVVAQDRGTATNFGMPGSAAAAGVTDAVLSVHGIASYLEEETREL